MPGGISRWRIKRYKEPGSKAGQSWAPSLYGERIGAPWAINTRARQNWFLFLSEAVTRGPRSIESWFARPRGQEQVPPGYPLDGLERIVVGHRAKHPGLACVPPGTCRSGGRARTCSLLQNRNDRKRAESFTDVHWPGITLGGSFDSPKFTRASRATRESRE